MITVDLFVDWCIGNDCKLDKYYYFLDKVNHFNLFTRLNKYSTKLLSIHENITIIKKFKAEQIGQDLFL